MATLQPVCISATSGPISRCTNSQPSPLRAKTNAAPAPFTEVVSPSSLKVRRTSGAPTTATEFVIAIEKPNRHPFCGAAGESVGTVIRLPGAHASISMAGPPRPRDAT